MGSVGVTEAERAKWGVRECRQACEVARGQAQGGGGRDGHDHDRCAPAGADGGCGPGRGAVSLPGGWRESDGGPRGRWWVGWLSFVQGQARVQAGWRAGGGQARNKRRCYFYACTSVHVQVVYGTVLTVYFRINWRWSHDRLAQGWWGVDSDSDSGSRTLEAFHTNVS